MSENEEGRQMTKLTIALLGAAVLATGGYAAATGLDNPEPSRTVTLPGGTTETTTTDRMTTVATTAAGTTMTNGGVDISGPCDEAEHRNDPRCTGGAGADGHDDDRSGSSSGPGGDNENNANDDDDRSGSNSGRG
jgi:hypothetical protein